MNDLVEKATEAHGGLETWRSLNSLSGHVIGSGPFFERVGQGDQIDLNFVGLCHEQQMSLSPLGQHGQRAVIRPDYESFENEKGQIVSERTDPRSHFPAEITKGWDDLNFAYFAGYALWNYLSAPFIWTLPGVETQELAPVPDGGAELQRLLVRYPAEMMTHSREETFYISQDGLIVRVDYAAEVTGGVPAANFASNHRKVAGGLIMPTRRSVKRRLPDGTATDPVIISLEIDNLEYA